MASIATDATDDVGSEVLGFRAVELAMSNLTAILASLVLIITEGTVKSSEFTKLIALQLILTFGDRCSLEWLDVVCKMGGAKLTVSMMLWISFLALLTFSSVSAIIKQWRSSSWLLV